MKEKMKKLESECILSIGKAREKGKAKGRVLGKEETMDEARTQFQMVYNTGFRHGWKSALSKTGQPETSELFLHTNTPLPYPTAGLKNSDDEAEEEDDEDDGEDEEEGGPDRVQESSQPKLIEKATDVPDPTPSL